MFYMYILTSYDSFLSEPIYFQERKGFDFLKWIVQLVLYIKHLLQPIIYVY